MRTVSFALNISLDGYCDHTIFNPGPEVHDYFTELMGNVELLFFGRVIYQLMFPYWSDLAENQSGSEDEIRFARKLTSIDKVVVSTTLTEEDLVPGTRIVRSHPAEELLKLKQQSGGKISVDSVSMLPELIGAGLIDEFHLVVLPVLAGKGRRLLDDINFEQLELKLADTKIFQSGAVALHYVKQ